MWAAGPPGTNLCSCHCHVFCQKWMKTTVLREDWRDSTAIRGFALHVTYLGSIYSISYDPLSTTNSNSWMQNQKSSLSITDFGGIYKPPKYMYSSRFYFLFDYQGLGCSRLHWIMIHTQNLVRPCPGSFPRHWASSGASHPGRPNNRILRIAQHLETATEFESRYCQASA